MRGISLPGMKLGGYLMFATYFPQQVVIHLPQYAKLFSHGTDNVQKEEHAVHCVSPA